MLQDYLRDSIWWSVSYSRQIYIHSILNTGGTQYVEAQFLLAAEWTEDVGNLVKRPLKLQAYNPPFSVHAYNSAQSTMQY